MKKLSLAALVLASASVFAAPLRIVNVNAPAVNHVFEPSGVVTVTDYTAPIWTNGFLQSRYYRSSAASPAAGKYVYEYRVDLREVVGVLSIPYISTLTIDFGPTSPLDFNGDGRSDDVFVTTTGGLGTIGLASAVRTGNHITFTFTSPISGGGHPHAGTSSFFFGLVSPYAKRSTTATTTNSPGPNLSLTVTSPRYLRRFP